VTNLPVNIEAEQAILGALLIDNGVLSSLPYLEARHFSEAIHQDIFEAAAGRIQSGEPVSVLTIRELLPQDPQGLGVSINEYLARLAAAAVGTAMIDGVGRQVLRLSVRRRLFERATEVAKQANAVTSVIDPADVISDLEIELLDLADDLSRADRDAPETLDSVVDDIRKRMSSGQRYVGARTGFRNIDRLVGGLAPGDFVLLAGRPSMGKTALGLAIARKAARLGHGVGFVSIEMTATQVRHRLLSTEADFLGTKIAYTRMRTAQTSANEWKVINQASANLKTLPFWLADQGNRLSDIPGHIRTARRHLERQGVKLELMVIDYLGLLRPSDRYIGNKVQETGEISNTLKTIAKREGIALMALHQLSRASEGRDDYRPRPSDLRNSGDLEQDADVIMFVHREGYFIERPGYRKFGSEIERRTALQEVEHNLEVIIPKQRQGAVGTSKLWCNLPVNTIEDRHDG